MPSTEPRPPERHPASGTPPSPAPDAGGARRRPGPSPAGRLRPEPTSALTPSPSPLMAVRGNPSPEGAPGSSTGPKGRRQHHRPAARGAAEELVYLSGRVPRALRDELHIRAIQEGRPVVDLLRNAIRAYLDHTRPTPR
jgi:hypothetical protein